MSALFPQPQSTQAYIEFLEKSIAQLQADRQSWIATERSLQAQVQALIQLSQSEALNQRDFQGALEELTEVTARVLQVERVSVWLFDPDRTSIRCLDLFEQSHGQHVQGIELQVTDYPNYFAAVESEPLIVAEDAQTNPNTCEFREGYLIPLNIQSMLDSGFQLDGQVGGVICCEQVGTKREWSQADQNFIRSAAHLISLIVESHRRQQQTLELQQVLEDLKQAQLQVIQSEKMSALGNLVAGIAHEINNPVSYLSGNIQPAVDYSQSLFQLIDLYQATYPMPGAAILEEIDAIDLEFLREDFPKAMRSMREGVNRIQAISQSLRLFSRADQDHKQAFNVHDGLESTLLILEHRLKATESRPAIVVSKQYGDLPLVQCFPGPLNQVFMNLLANAIDALEESNQGKALSDLRACPNQITLQTWASDEYVSIQISDNGTGMSEAVQKRIFEHLFTTKAVGKGTGFGLAIAQQIMVEQHQGCIQVNSRLGEGTSFLLELPL